MPRNKKNCKKNCKKISKRKKNEMSDLCTDCRQGEAVYRAMKGHRVFMGIVKRGETLVKLDDPRGALDGPGHEMDEVEFQSECSLYDESSMPRPITLEPICGASKPSAVTQYLTQYLLPEDARDAVFFPFDMHADGSLVAHVRSGDHVYVLHEYLDRYLDAHGRRWQVPRRESFWCSVVAVMTAADTPLIISTPMANLDWIDPGESVVFNACCVLAMHKGEHWR